jgi:hypothetical protein
MLRRLILALWPLLCAVPALAQSYTTLDPNYKGANFTLSNGNLTVTTTSGYQSVRGAEGKTSGKWYFEGHLDVQAGNIGIGVAGYLQAGSTNNYCGIGPATGGLGGTGTGVAAYQSGSWFGAIGSGGSLGTTGLTSFAVNDTVGIAVDIGNQKIWVRKNGGNWDGSGTDNPATNTGGLALTGSALIGPRYWPCVSLQSNTDKVTVNFGATAFGTAAPSGFTGWTSTYSYLGSLAYATCNGASTRSLVVNTLWVADFTPTSRTSIADLLISLGAAGMTSSAAVVYDSDGAAGVPGTLIASSASLVSTPGLPGYDLPISPTFALTGGHKYYVGFITGGGTSSPTTKAATTAAYTNGSGSPTPSSIPTPFPTPTATTGSCGPAIELQLAAAPAVAGGPFLRHFP